MIMNIHSSRVRSFNRILITVEPEAAVLNVPSMSLQLFNCIIVSVANLCGKTMPLE